MGSGSVADGPEPRVGSHDPAFRQQLHDGISADWASGRLKYDIRHWMANFGNMSAADKNSPMFRVFMGYVSDAIYKMLPGEADRVRAHLVLLGMDDQKIRRVRRSTGAERRGTRALLLR
jgi:hypothetical protein